MDHPARPVLAALALAAALALSGCDQAATDADDTGPDPDAVRSGLTALYAGDHATEEDRAAGRCFARELTDRASTEELQDAGILDEDAAVVTELPLLDEPAARTWVDAQFACVDFVEESARAQRAATKGKVDEDEYAACLRAGITDEQLRAAVVAAMTGDLAGPAVTRLSRAQVACT